MPPIRSTPPRNRFAASTQYDEDHGFNPAWALRPDQTFTFSIPVAKPTIVERVSSTKLPAPDVVVTTLSSKDRRRAFNLENNIDGVTWGVLLPLAFVYNAIKGATDLASGAINSVGSVVVRVGGAVRRKVWSQRHNPISTSGRRNRTPARKPSKDSMLQLPPHLVGATPNVVRQARGQRLRGEPSTQTPTIEEARKWKLFHDTPLSKKPRPVPETPIASGANSGPDTPWKTPKFEVSSQRTLKLGKTKEFALNVHKEEFKGWLSVLKKNGSRTTTLRRDLVEKLAFPTELILTLYNKKVKEGSGHAFDSLMKCFSHDGFTTHYKILVPAIKYPTPHKFRRGEIKDIDLDAVRQQADGCCKFCRGFAWAGQAEEREIEKGAEVPCHSWHKSVKPYTAEENAEFSQHKYDMLFRRWCRESRYDWIFETPKLSGSWEIPKDDPRLRHITMLKQQHKTAVDAPKLYDADLISSYNELRAKLSKQDIAARIMIEAIRRENPPLARTYERMDLERRRKQVKIDWLCVKQVKVIVKSPPKKQKPTELVPLATKPAKRSAGENLFPVDPEKSAKRVKFASEPEGPTTTGQKTPSKGILKTSNSVANKQTPKSQKKTSFKRAKIASFSAGKPKANSQPTFQFGAPEIKNQANGATNGHQPNFFTAPVPALVPTFQSNNPKLNFNAVPSLAPQNSSGQVFFFGAAATNNGGYNGQLPPAFDPAVLRQQYNSGGSTAGNYWDELKPIGWNADPGLTKEENDADRVNYNIQKRTDTMNRERELRNQEIAEEKTWKPVFKPNGAMGNAKVGFRL